MAGDVKISRIVCEAVSANPAIYLNAPRRCGSRCDIQIARLVVSLESKEARGYMNKPKDWPWFIVLGCVLVVLIARFLPWTGSNIPATSDVTNAARRDATAGSPTARPGGAARHYATGAPAHTAEEIVARKFTQFGMNRREPIQTLAKPS